MHSLPSRSVPTLAFGFVILQALLCSSVAIANLQVFPIRAVLTDQKRAASLTLRHTGTKEETYKISIVYMKEGKSGKLETFPVPEPGDRSAKEMVKFSPKEVVMKPGSEQTVRLMLFNPKVKEDGEFRAFIRFEPANGEKREVASADGSGVQMALAVKIAVAVPVYYRKGQVQNSLKFTNLAVHDDPTAGKRVSLEFDAELVGNGMPFTNLRLVRVPESGPEVEVAKVQGYSFYTPKKHVKLSVANLLGEEKLPEGAKYRLEVNENDEDGGKLLGALSM